MINRTIQAARQLHYDTVDRKIGDVFELDGHKWIVEDKFVVTEGYFAYGVLVKI